MIRHLYAPHLVRGPQQRIIAGYKVCAQRPEAERIKAEIEASKEFLELQAASGDYAVVIAEADEEYQQPDAKIRAVT